MARNADRARDSGMASKPPIRHVVVLGHPSTGSFNHQVAETYCQVVRACGQEVALRDLYASGFDPLLKAEERPGHGAGTLAADVAAELDALAGARVLVLVYPIWFGSPPAIIKGYVDRVLSAGLGPHEAKAGAAHPLLAGARLMTFSSSAATTPWPGERGQWISLRQSFDNYLTDVFAMREARRRHFKELVDGLDQRFVLEKLEEVRQDATALAATLDQERAQRALHPAAWPSNRRPKGFP
jgi:NAD(P)H dehydrogenase (quinone)